MQFDHESQTFNLDSVESELVRLPFGVDVWPGSDTEGLLRAIQRSSRALGMVDTRLAAQKFGHDAELLAQKARTFQGMLAAMETGAIEHLTAGEDIDAELASLDM